VISPLFPWRVAGATAAFVLAGSSAMLLAMHDRPAGAVAYQAWPAPTAPATPGLRVAAAARTASGREALQLMTKAARACRTSAFTGVEDARWWGPAGLRVWLGRIWHRPGAATIDQPLDSADGQSAVGPGLSTVISGQQLAQLRLGFELFYEGTATSGDRRADVVAIDRPDGTLAAKYWLDAATGLPLRRQLFDGHAHVVSDISITSLQTGPQAVRDMPVAASAVAMQELGPPGVSALRAKGWPLPDELPGGLMLVGAGQAALRSGPVVGLTYSDGLSVISLFVQRGVLTPMERGWRRLALGSHDVYALDPDDQSIVWTGDGYVFAMSAQAPSAALDLALSALPHSGEPGFWGRLERGFRRLASSANPFR
jgi:sigma-E factor negative regulatory protein RseB